MSLMVKFSVLSLMLAATLLIGLGVPTWVASTSDREVQAAQSNLMLFVDALNQIKDCFEYEVEEFNRDNFSQSDRDGIESQSQQISETLQKIDSSARFRQYVGSGVAPAFAQRVEQTRSQLEEALQVDPADPGFDQTVAVATDQVDALQGVLGLVEERLSNELQLTIAHSHEVRSLIHRVSFWSVGLALLVGMLAILLLRRWVVLPVLELRVAASQIAAGNFGYRITNYGHDELGVLSHEINQMAGTIADMQNQAVAREQFATVEELTRRLAHNLRNPLAGIRSLAESARVRPIARSQIDEDLNLIISTVDRFEAWLTKLLHSATTLEVHASEDSPGDLLMSVYEAHLPMARAKSIEFVVRVDEVPELAVFDRMHLEQAVVALTTNALEATPPGGRVVIGGTVSRALPEWSISIEDSGPGIRADDRHEVFRPYFTTKPGGTGLGLALVRNVARAHGGRVEIGHSDVCGAIFTIHLSKIAGSTQSGEDDGQHRSG